MKVKLLMVSLLCLSLAACGESDPQAVTLPVPASVLDIVNSFKVKRAVQTLSHVEQDLLKSYLLRTALDDGRDRPALTIGQAIDAQRAWLAEQEAQAARQQAQKEAEAAQQQAMKEEQEQQQQLLKENEAKQQALIEEIEQQKAQALDLMNAAVSASLASLKLKEKDYKKKIYSDYIDVELIIKNNSESDLSGFKGALVLKDTSGAPVKTLEISASAEIEAGQAVLYTTKLDHNPLIDEDKLLATLDTDKIHYEWVPKAYTFKNGEILKMPN